jgi:hypothetical protein
MLSRNLQEVIDRFCYVVQDNASNHTCIFPDKSSYYVCKWFELFHSKAKSCVINNGHMSIFFSLERGSRQGDLLSPYLCIIGVELLSLKLKANQDIHGIIINEVESLISLYADDQFPKP